MYEQIDLHDSTGSDDESIVNSELLVDRHDLQERFGLAFDPEHTVRGVGSTGLTLAYGPLYTEAVDIAPQNDDQKEESMTETVGAYAQEKPEYQQYVARATQLVHELARGDESGLSAVPPFFQQALSERMKIRLSELMSGDITQGEFNLELKKMISVACTGMREKSEN